MDHRGAWILRECIECEIGIEFQESHTTSCPNKYIWNGKDLRDLWKQVSNYSKEFEWL